MKKLFYRLSSNRSMAKIFSMDAQLEERKRVIFPKRLFFAVLGLAAFVSLGALLLPQVVEADDCLFDCFDAGAQNPWGQSPQAIDLAYCFDRECVLDLNVNGVPIFTGNSIPTPHVTHSVTPAVTSTNCDGTAQFTVTISTPTAGDYVVVLLRDQTTGNLIPGSQTLATLNIVIEGVTCSPSGSDQILSKVLILDPHIPAGQPRTDVFDATSHITVGPGIPSGFGWEQGCIPGATSICSFALGIPEFQNKTDEGQVLPAVARVPIVNSSQFGEVYRGVKSTRFFDVRDCKGDPTDGVYDPILGPTTIACSVGAVAGGGEAQGLFTFAGSWSGAKGKTINPKSSTGQFDILTPLFGSILPETVTASANSGPEVPNSGCNDNPSQNRERCFFAADDLLPNGCTPGQPVAVLVRGKLDSGTEVVGFAARDNPTCNLNK